MIIDIVCTFSTTTIEAEATSISLVLTFPVTQAPSNICDEVKTCLGISPSGSNTKYLNEKGLWTTPAGGGGGGVVIEATKAEFLALVAANDLTCPATYKITDIENGLFLETLSANTYNPQGVLSLLIPDYDIAPQLVMGDTVNVGERYAWGNQIWENTSGSNPDAVNQLELEATDWDLVPKSLANDYVAIQLNVTWDAIGDLFTFANQSGPQNEYAIGEILSGVLGADAIHANQWIDKINQSVNFTLNNKVSSSGDGILNNSVRLFDNVVDGGLANNFGDANSTIEGNNVGAGCGIGDNELRGGSVYEENVLSNGGQIIKMFSVNSEMSGNIISGDGCNIGYGFQHDASSCRDNEITGENSTIQAFQQNNNSELNENIITGDDNVISGFSQLVMDKFNGNSFVGNINNFFALTQNGYSEVSGFDVQANSCQFSNIEQSAAILKNFTYTEENDIIGLQMSNCTIENGNNISIRNCSFDHDLDLTGFTVDIEGETIHSGKGWFSYKRNFATSNLLTTEAILHNIIPIGARITNLVISGSANGNSIQIGLSGDDESLLVLPTSLLNNQLITVSNAATANRSLLIKALSDPITTGEITVKCEFVC